MQKNVLITGCSSGFGYGMALKFSRAGDKVFAAVRDLKSDGSKKLTQLAHEENLPIELIYIDVTKQSTIDDAIKLIVKKTKQIDVLINNAGFGYMGPVEDFSIEEVKHQYDTNIYGVLRMVKAVAPIMRKQKQGIIINFSSISGLVPFPLYGIYSSSKYAIETISESLRFELSHFGITVLLIEPGSFATNFSTNRTTPQLFGTPNSAYKTLSNNFWTRYRKTHDQSHKSFFSKTRSPQRIIDAVFNLTQKDNPPFRTRIGVDAQLHYYVKKLLPQPIWEWLLHKAYKW